jgi:hypothetical protein
LPRRDKVLKETGAEVVSRNYNAWNGPALNFANYILKMVHPVYRYYVMFNR